MPTYLLKIKNKNIDYALVPASMSAVKKAQFAEKRITTFKDYKEIQAPNAKAAMTKLLRDTGRIGKTDSLRLKDLSPRRL
jgi:hypothetical protein